MSSLLLSLCCRTLPSGISWANYSFSVWGCSPLGGRAWEWIGLFCTVQQGDCFLVFILRSCALFIIWHRAAIPETRKQLIETWLCQPALATSLSAGRSWPCRAVPAAPKHTWWWWYDSVQHQGGEKEHVKRSSSVRTVCDPYELAPLCLGTTALPPFPNLPWFPAICLKHQHTI